MDYTININQANMEKYKNFINNSWVDSESKETIKVEDQATAKYIGEIACAKKTEVDLAVNAAKESFNSRILIDMPLLERAKLMHKIADETRKIAQEGGKILTGGNRVILNGEAGANSWQIY